jgi:AraC-like DNA-binding protein
MRINQPACIIQPVDFVISKAGAVDMKQTTGVFQFHDFKNSLGIEAVYGENVTHDFSRHTHRTLCIGVIEHGLRCFFCRGINYSIKPGQVFVIPPNEAHSCGPSIEPHTYRLLLVSPDVLRAVLPNMRKDSNSQYLFVKLVIEDNELYEQMLTLHQILATRETDFIKQSMLFSAIGNTMEQCVAVPSKMIICRKHHEYVMQAQSFIEEHYGESFSLNDLAEHVYLSPYYLIRVFSQIAGIPPHIYQQQVRIRHAKSMLVQGISIVEIANKTGFTDQSHFSNVFKKLVGVTPGEYSVS